MIIVLTPKGNTDTQGIGLLDTLWKVVEAIIDTSLKLCITFHNVFHDFCTVRVMGKSILELKIIQDLDSIDQDPLFLVSLNPRKVYDTLNWGRLLTTMEVYVAGPHICRILEEFWERQEVIKKKSGYNGPNFQATEGTTQRGIILSTLFNMVVKNAVRNWLHITVEDKLFDHYGLAYAVGQCMGMFFADDVLFWSRDPEWIQGYPNGIIGLFRQYILVANITQFKAMMCQPEEIQSRISEEALIQKSTWRG